jgi:hypothetical protein
MNKLDWNFNDGGRASAGFKGTTGDCVCRAIAIATGKEYREVYDSLNQIAKDEKKSKRRRSKSSSRTGVYRVTYDKYLKSLGWTWVPTMQVGQGVTHHLRDGELPDGRIICRLSKHLCCVIDGVIQDVFDPSRNGTRAVYGYWLSPDRRTT